MKNEKRRTTDNPRFPDFASQQESVPPGYKRTEVGVIPEDWFLVPLNCISDFITKGSTPTTFGYKWESSGIIFLRSECVSSQGLDFRQSMFISQSAHMMLYRSEVRDGDLLITITGNVGRAVRLCGVGVANINQHIARIRISAPNAEADYVYHFLSQTTVRRRFETITTGQAYPQISLEQVRQTKVSLPSLPEQRAIAEALSDVDKLLESLDTLIAKKRAIKQAAIQQLLTGKTRLPEFSGKWEVRRLGCFVKFLRQGTFSRADLSSESPLRYLHYGDIHTYNKVYIDPHITPMPCLPMNLGKNLDRLETGDLVFVDASEDVDGIGKSVEITNVGTIEIVSGLHTIAARFDKSILADGFKAYLQFCPAFQSHLKKLAAGTKVYATNRKHIASSEVPLPGIDEQTAIASVLSDMDAEIAALEARREKTRAIKRGMMQQLLTGRVRLVEPEAAA